MEKIALNVGSLCGPNSGPLSMCVNDPKEAPIIFGNVLSLIIGVISIIGAIWFIFVLITGAVSLISSEGDKAAVETARKKITTGLIGLVVVIAGVFIVDIIGTLIGIDFLNPVNFIVSPPR